MTFNSFSYVFVFLPVVAIVCAALRRGLGARAAQLWILAASLAFYAWSDPWHLPLLLGSIAVNGLVARGLGEKAPHRRPLFWAGIAMNIGLLCLFKYVNFALRGLAMLGLPALALPDWRFPLGISFFTLTQVMYLVDCYEGLIPASNLLDHATFVSFFPYVISGPLTRAKSMIRQLGGTPPDAQPGVDRLAGGLYLFSMGLFKKVIFADSFARVADIGYGSIGGWSSMEAWIFSLAYTFQIYFDFSGYSDMALGSARILGFEIPKNFNAPLRSRTVTEFWQRWHISLSGFITTYLYTPILRSFKVATPSRAVAATMAAMTIAGLWHGPSWTFIVFGALHGLALSVNQLWKRKKRKLPAPLAWAMTFVFVNLSFIFFRSPNLGTAWGIVTRLVPLHQALGTSVVSTVRTMGVTTLVPPLLAGVAAAFVGKTSDELARDFRPSYATSLGTVARLLPSLLYMNSSIAKAFVYFAF
jgi:D-alanyl-lipoteichoic acid acyltransferase DltB (MBOAT superfamily)